MTIKQSEFMEQYIPECVDCVQKETCDRAQKEIVFNHYKGELFPTSCSICKRITFHRVKNIPSNNNKRYWLARCRECGEYHIIKVDKVD